MIDRVDQRIGQAGAPGIPSRAARTETADGSFAAVFKDRLAGVRLSRHAEERLAAARPLDEGDMARLAGAVDAAAARGARESLVVMDGLALVVNVRNRMVITAVDEDRMGDQVFTNIDSAVLALKGAGPLGGGPGRGPTEAAGERHTAVKGEVDSP